MSNFETRFKPQERVVFRPKHGDKHGGRMGRFREYSPEGSDYVSIILDGDDHLVRCMAYELCRVSATSETGPKFKVGDAVVIMEHGLLMGKTGRVTAVAGHLVAVHPDHYFGDMAVDFNVEDVRHDVRPPAKPRNPKDIMGESKPDLSLIPPVSMLHEAMAMELGAFKYGPYNFRDTPVEARTYMAAAKRHIDNWLDGEEYCSDTKDAEGNLMELVHNLGAAKAGLGIVLDCLERGTLVDNRPLKGTSSAVQDRMKAAKQKWKGKK